MAKMPPAKSPPPPAADDTDPTAAAGDTGTESGEDDDTDAGADEGDSGDVVLVTITRTADGTYMVYAGDEDEGDEGAEDDGSAAPADAGATAPVAGGTGAGDIGGSAGKPADGIGAALKEVLTILKDDEASASGQGSAEDNFQAGFAGGTSASPPRPTMQQKF